MPDVYMIGGANGSGKTTAALTLLPRYLDVFEFVNADEIARGLNPLKPETADIAAAKVMIQRIRNLTDAKKNFAFETTCAGTHHIQTLHNCQVANYTLNMIYFWLPSAEMAVKRVKSRIQQGGHAIPENTIRRRYASGIRNAMTTYLNLVDTAMFFDNSDIFARPKIIAEKLNGAALQVYEPVIWEQMLVTIKQGERK